MKNLSVMLIEDNADDEFLAIRALNKAGLENITVARNGLEAITMLQGNDTTAVTCRQDLIFLDLRLPKLDGIDVLRKIRSSKLTQFMKVVVLTSAEAPQCKQVCHDLAVAAYLLKPLQANDVISLGLA
jgi:CheY-like chemotaxis protein